MTDRRRKLSAQQVASLRAGREAGKTIRELAKQFGMSVYQTWAIANYLSRKK